MASSSRSYKTHLKNTEDFNFFKEEKASKDVQEEDEKEEDWLNLGLGLGSSTSSSSKKIVSHNPISASSSSFLSSSSQTVLSCPQIGLGFEDKGLGLESIRKGKEGLGGLDCFNDHHHNGMLSSPPSSSSCQIMNPCGEDLAIPIPSDSHHYFAGSNNVNHHHNQSGLWFTLHSFTNRNGETLPQISKEYIRVKDENMTVLMVKKYLVTKLGLSNEAENGSEKAAKPARLQRDVERLQRDVEKMDMLAKLKGE